jgi:secreted PhoX family phosphatase
MSPHENDFKVAPENVDNTHFNEVMQAFMSRRQVLQGSMAMALSSFLGVSLSACSDDENESSDGSVTPTMNFTSAPTSTADTIQLAAGYTATVFAPYGASLFSSVPDYKNDGKNTAEQQNSQVGDHHDGMWYFPINGSSDNGILCINHENITRVFMHDPVLLPDDPKKSIPTLEQARKEVRAHGITVMEIKKVSGQWQIVKDSKYNRRITGETVHAITGPVAGSNWVKTPYSTDGTKVRGTLNNCGSGYTPWGTYLSGEENWAGYFYSEQFTSDYANHPELFKRYGVGQGWQGYFWHDASLASANGNGSGEFARFDVSPGSAWVNEPNAFGWMVEVDPYNPSSTPKKRTAMGRFAHEGCDYSPLKEGKPIAFYMGCDSRFEYIYKFVTKNNYSKATSNGDNMLDEGTLYAAKFNSDGTGEWLPLTMSNPKLAGKFADQAELLVKTRMAADAVGATPMDRPEWSTVSKKTGDIYFTLTNNSRRGDGAIQRGSVEEALNKDIAADAANPRNRNSHGHIIRMREENEDATATKFAWDIFAFGAPANAPVTTNLSLLDESNEFASPDGIWIFDNGLMMIQTDDGSITNRTNNQLLLCMPNRVGEGNYVSNAAGIKRFFVGPKDCEITGITMTPDNKTLFINVQHPGENTTDISKPTSAWPKGNADAGATNRAQSAVVIITKNDGGIIGA